MTNVATIQQNGVLDPHQLYFSDNGRVTCGRLGCAGMSAYFSGLALDGFPVVSLKEAAREAQRAGEAFDLTIFKCEGCGQKQCPQCGAPMSKETGTISELVIATGANHEPKRRARLGTFYSCSGCENCVEVTRG